MHARERSQVKAAHRTFGDLSARALNRALELLLLGSLLALLIADFGAGSG